MLPSDPTTFTPPDPRPNPAITSTQWEWTPGTRCRFQSDELFGPGGEGGFSIDDYRNGYFWGSGEGRVRIRLAPSAAQAGRPDFSDETFSADAPGEMIRAMDRGRARRSARSVETASTQTSRR